MEKLRREVRLLEACSLVLNSAGDEFGGLIYDATRKDGAGMVMASEGNFGAERLFVGRTRKDEVGLFIRDNKR